MERMMDLDEIFREEAEKYKNSKSVEVYEEQLEGWFKIIDELREENKNLKEENEYRKKIADVLPEGEGHIAEETIQDLQKEIKLLKMSLEEKDESCYSLAKENKNLKEELKELRERYNGLKQRFPALKED